MEKIASFTIDHTCLQRGMYISRVDGDVVTYDIRTRRPNVEAVMDNAVIHSIEHLFATYVRSSRYRDAILYFGPMGCRTGFYFLTRNTLSDEEAVRLTEEAFRFIVAYEGEIPGVSAAECGNFREHSAEGARREAAAFLPVLVGWNAKKLSYS